MQHIQLQLNLPSQWLCFDVLQEIVGLSYFLMNLTSNNMFNYDKYHTIVPLSTQVHTVFVYVTQCLFVSINTFSTLFKYYMPVLITYIPVILTKV